MSLPYHNACSSTRLSSRSRLYVRIWKEKDFNKSSQRLDSTWRWSGNEKRNPRWIIGAKRSEKTERRSPERHTWKGSGRRTPEDRRVDGETIGEGRGTDQIPDDRERALKKASEVRRVGETYELTPAKKYQTINTVIRIAQLKNLVRPLCEIVGVSRSGNYAWLNREFGQSEPGKIFVTDITYLPIASGENVYLSCVKNVTTREIVAYKLSTNLRIDQLEEHLQGIDIPRQWFIRTKPSTTPIRATSDSLIA